MRNYGRLSDIKVNVWSDDNSAYLPDNMKMNTLKMDNAVFTERNQAI